MNLLDNGFPTQASNFIKTKDMNVFLKEIGKDKAISKVFSSILLNKDKTDFREEILKAYGGEKDNDDEDVKKEKIAREERMRKIKTFFPKSKVLQRALENTTEGTESLIIADPGKEGKLPNEWLNDHRNWEDLHQFLPNLKNLTLE
ncbi:MAG: hypothetical protein LBI53_01465 [Candidatus Peribacteria bacterium]|jgi:hypothetical protein|nr:hypothetical protein [Candidatus Peribacteria bacterium]